MEHITSRSNRLLVHLRKLGTSGAYRRERGTFLCDGGKLLEEALGWGAEIEALLCAEGTVPPPLPPTVRAASVPWDVLRSVSPLETPQDILFSVKYPARPLPEVWTGGMVLDGVQDPGNVGTILRTADAFGAPGLLLLPGCADPFGPKAVRASMGAVFRLGAWSVSLEQLGAILRRSALPLIGAALGEHSYEVETMPRPAMTAVGSEGRGLSGAVLALCDGTVRIPMRQRCESLNAAMAAAVLLWEQRPRAFGKEQG